MNRLRLSNKSRSDQRFYPINFLPKIGGQTYYAVCQLLFDGKWKLADSSHESVRPFRLPAATLEDAAEPLHWMADIPLDSRFPEVVKVGDYDRPLPQ